MYEIVTYMWLKFEGEDLGKYSIHGAVGNKIIVTNYCHVFIMVVAAHSWPSVQASLGGGSQWTNPGEKILQQKKWLEKNLFKSFPKKKLTRSWGLMTAAETAFCYLELLGLLGYDFNWWFVGNFVWPVDHFFGTPSSDPFFFWELWKW